MLNFDGLAKKTGKNPSGDKRVTDKLHPYQGINQLSRDKQKGNPTEKHARTAETRKKRSDLPKKNRNRTSVDPMGIW